MNLDKIRVGMEIKNYKELCSLLEQPIKSGKSKIYQLREFERYFTCDRDKHKYIVTNIKEKPDEKIDGRINNGGHIANVKYDRLMDALIISALKRNRKIIASFIKIFTDTNYIPIFSNGYTDIIHGSLKTVSKKFNTTDGLISLYKCKTRDIVLRCFEVALNRLERENIIYWEKEIFIADKYGDKRLALYDEIKLIKEAEQHAYEELNITYFSRMKLDVNRKFMKIVKQNLPYSISSYWKEYNIQINDENVLNQLDLECDIEELCCRLITSIHTAILNKPVPYKFSGNFYPYKTSKYVFTTIRLDEYIWNCYIINADTKNNEFINNYVDYYTIIEGIEDRKAERIIKHTQKITYIKECKDIEMKNKFKEKYEFD